MIGYCVSDKYCQYKSDTGHCGYTGGCVQENATIKVSTEQRWSISKVVDISSDSIEEIADAVVKKLIGKERKRGKWIRNDNGTYSCNVCHSWIPEEQHYYARYCLYCGADMRGEKSEN